MKGFRSSKQWVNFYILNKREKILNYNKLLRVLKIFDSKFVKIMISLEFQAILANYIENVRKFAEITIKIDKIVVKLYYCNINL